MKKAFLTSILTPIITITICCILYLSGNFQMITGAIIILIASAIEYKKDLFKSLGFQRDKFNVKNLLIIAPLVGAAIFLFYSYVMLPSITYLTGQSIDLSVFDPYKGNLTACISLLGYIWTSAAFGEEIVFRGYLMRQFTKFFGSSTVSLVFNILLLGILFGYVHAYQGISGQLLSGITGMFLAIIFHFKKNDLWFNVAVHGFIDTVFVIYLYYGLM
jgi:membrane protease YdiL (CAAX protease family)